MTDEEKKAYNYLKNSTDEFLNSWDVAIKSDNFKKYDYMQLLILLNLIEKQQKEIEIFERIKNGETIMFSSKAQYWRRDKVEKYFISKDKIREKIEEYQKHIDNINNKAPKRKDGKPNNLFNHANKEFYKSKVEVLEELLKNE